MSDQILRDGLGELQRRWARAGNTLISRRLEGALGRDFRFECPGEPALAVRFERDAMSIRLADGSVPQAVFAMPRADWKEVLSGRWSVMTVVLGGRAGFAKHHRRSIMQLSMLMQALFLLEM